MSQVGMVIRCLVITPIGLVIRSHVGLTSISTYDHLACLT